MVNQVKSPTSGNTEDDQYKAYRLEMAKHNNDADAQKRITENYVRSQIQRDNNSKKADARGTVLGADATNVATTSGNAVGVGKDAATENIRKEGERLTQLLSLTAQAVQANFQNNNSIEQMKANFSGMVNVFAIVCDQFGWTDVAKSAHELADRLQPEFVKPDMKSVYALAGKLGVSKEAAKSAIDQVYNGGKAASDYTGSAGKNQVGKGIENFDEGLANLPVTVVDNGSRHTAASALNASSFDKTLSAEMAKGDVTYIQSKKLRDAFPGIVSREGDKSTIDTAKEKAAVGTLADQLIQDAGKAQRVKAALGIDIPAPTVAASRAPRGPELTHSGT